MRTEDQQQVARLTATFMTGTAVLTLQWAGNGLLVLVGVMLIAELVTGLDLLSPAFALSPTALWVTSWVAGRRQNRLVEAVVARTRGRS